MEDKSFESIRETFWQIYCAISEFREDDILTGPASVSKIIRDRLAQLASVKVDPASAVALQADNEFQGAVIHLYHVNQLLEQRREVDDARLLISSPHPLRCLRSLPCYRVYRQLVAMEMNAAELNAGDCVAFLGGGALPMTSILLYLEHGVTTVSIERCPEYAELSSEVVRRLGFDDVMRIIEGNHFWFPLPRVCNLLVVGYRAEPKSDIFKYLARALDNGSKVSYREPEDIPREYLKYLGGIIRQTQLALCFDPSNYIPSVFREYRRVRPKPPVEVSLVLTVKDRG